MVVDALNICVDTGTIALRERADTDPVLQRLQTIPGVGPITASIYAGAIIDPGRLSGGRDVGAYLGLVPSLYQSGATMRRGRITKRGNRQARWALCMAGNAVLNSKKSTPLVDPARGLEGRIGRKKSIIATARKLASVMWAVWIKEVEYDARRVAWPHRVRALHAAMDIVQASVNENECEPDHDAWTSKPRMHRSCERLPVPGQRRPDR